MTDRDDVVRECVRFANELQTTDQWRQCPEGIGTSLSIQGTIAVLDPALFEIYRDEADGPLFARKRPRPAGLPTPTDAAGAIHVMPKPPGWS